MGRGPSAESILRNMKRADRIVESHAPIAGDMILPNDSQLKGGSFTGKVKSLNITGDQTTADTAYVPVVLYNTDATPPTASNFPIGTIYIQYTA